MNLVKARREEGAICHICKSPDYSYMGREWEPAGKHNFKCNSCGSTWQYGNGDSHYLRLSNEQNMKIIGIVIDNYKVAKFEVELKKAGFVDFQVTPLSEQFINHTAIKIKVEYKQFESSKKIVQKVCGECERYFLQRKKNRN